MSDAGTSPPAASGAGSLSLKTAKIKPNSGHQTPGGAGNTFGLILQKTMANIKNLGAEVAAAIQSEAEKQLQAMASGSKEAAQYYKDNLSQLMHEFAGDAMDKGGTLAMAGGATAAAGGALSATVAGAPIGVPMAAGGAAAATAGGVVAGVGAGTETAASAMDAVADAVISGKAPDVVQPLIGLATRLLENAIAKRLPGYKSAKGHSGSKGGADGNKGAVVLGKGRCDLRRFREGCADGKTPHHIVGDHSFKQPGVTGAYYPAGTGKFKDGFTHADGWTVCAGGKTKSSAPDGTRIKKSMFARVQDWFSGLDEHGKIHFLADAEEVALGALGTPKGTTSLGALEVTGAAAAATVLGCDKAKMIKDLREAHAADGLPADMKVRADPFGAVRGLDPNSMGTGTTYNPGRGN